MCLPILKYPWGLHSGFDSVSCVVVFKCASDSEGACWAKNYSAGWRLASSLNVR